MLFVWLRMTKNKLQKEKP